MNQQMLFTLWGGPDGTVKLEGQQLKMGLEAKIERERGKDTKAIL
jgi:hypothetical protein